MGCEYIMPAMDYVAPIDSELQQQVIARTLDFIQLAEDLFRCRLPVLPVKFDLKGRSSGMYRVRGGDRVIRYNPWIFARHFDECLESTVPHEVAHYVTDRLWGLANIRPHGVEWKSVMAAFGVEARVTGSMSLEGIPQRKITYFAYSCRCTSHKLGVRRHRRIVRRQSIYRCRRCGDVLVAER